MVAPFYISFLLMVIAPLVYAFRESLYQTRIIGGKTFVALENFVRAFEDPLFLEAIRRVIGFILIQVPLTIGFALLFALLFDGARILGGRYARLSMFVPNAIPVVVGALMWGYLYGSDFGLIAQVASALGLPDPQLLAPGSIFGSIINIAFWAALGYNMILLYAALQSIPSELYEAAEVDGASRIRIAWHVKIPLIRPTIMLATLLALIIGFQLFNEPQLLQPLAVGAISSNYTPNLYIYNVAFSQQALGYAGALSFVLGFVIVVVSYVAQTVAARRAR